jgi:hypothetical protein
VVLHRLVADAELARDQLVAVAAGNLVEELDLARGEFDEQRAERLAVGRRGGVQRGRGLGRWLGLAKAGQDARRDGG